MTDTQDQKISDKIPSFGTLNIVLDNFQTIKNAYRAQESIAAGHFKDALEVFFEDFFKQVPSIQRVQWDQYTPFFADGDPIVFGVYSLVFFSINFPEDANTEPDERGRIDAWVLDREDQYSKFGLTKAECEFMKEVDQIVQSYPELMLQIFEDHSTVTVTKNGFVVTDCEHD